MMLSLVATGIAPGSFYELDADGNRQRAHYDGLPVEFIAEAISTLGAQVADGFETYHVMNPYDDGIGLDEFVDWLIDAGYPIQRDRRLRRLAAAVRDRAAGPARPAAPGVAAAAAAQLPAAGKADPRVDRARRTGSARRCRTRKSVRTRTFRTSRRRSSSSTSPTCNCSDCYETKDQQLGDPIVSGRMALPGLNFPVWQRLVQRAQQPPSLLV